MLPLLVKRPRRILALGLIVFLASACSPTALPISPTETPIAPITPYLTRTPTPTGAAQTVQDPGTPTSVPTPTPTPVTYTIAEGDTLLAIGFRYGITLNELLAANPGIDPNFLIIGTAIVLPVTENSVGAITAPTPIPLSIQQPVCYPDAGQGGWCFASVKNTTDLTLENITVQMTLAGPNDSPQVQTALPAVNRLLPGQSIPVMSYFSALPKDAVLQASITNALPLNPEQPRTIEVEVTQHTLQYSASNRSATITGEISVPADQLNGSKLRIAAVAYDQAQRVVGVKQVENSGNFAAGGSYPFSLTVFSLGPAIAAVDIYPELRP